MKNLNVRPVLYVAVALLSLFSYLYLNIVSVQEDGSKTCIFDDRAVDARADEEQSEVFLPDARLLERTAKAIQQVSNLLPR